MSFSEKELFAAKFAKILLQIGCGTLKYQITNMIAKLDYSDISQFFDQNFNEIESRKSINHFKIIYWNLVKKQNNVIIRKQVTNLDEFDISASCSVIINILTSVSFPNNSNISDVERINIIQSFNPEINKNCEVLRDLRNKYFGHLVLFELEKKTFDEKIIDLCKMIFTLCDVKEIPKLKQEIDRIKSIQLVDVQFIESARKMAQREVFECRDDFQGFLKNIVQNLNENHIELKVIIESFLNQYMTISRSIEETQIVFNEKIVSLINKKFESAKTIFLTSKYFDERLNQMDEKNEQRAERIINNQIQGFSRIENIINRNNEKLNATMINCTTLKETFSDKIFGDYFNLLVVTEREEILREDEKINKILSAFNWDVIIDLDQKCESSEKSLALVIKKAHWDLFNRKIVFYNIEDLQKKLTYEKPTYILGNGSELRESQRIITKTLLIRNLSPFFEDLIRKHQKKFRIIFFLLKDELSKYDIERLRGILECFIDSKQELDRDVNLTMLCLTPNRFENIQVNQKSIDDALFDIFNNLDEVAPSSSSVGNNKRSNTYICRDSLNNISNSLSEIKHIQSKKEVRYLPRYKLDPTVLDEQGFYPYENKDKKILQVYHMSCGENSATDPTTILNEARSFLSGEKQITPEIIYLNNIQKIYATRDVIAKSTSPLRKKIQEKIDSLRIDSDENTTSAFSNYIFKIFHEPSAGGTTVARLLLHLFRDKVPCVEVLDMTNYKLVADGIDFLSMQVEHGLPIMILLDSPKICFGSTIDDLISELKWKRQIKTIIILVERLSVIEKINEENNEFEVKCHVSEAEDAQFKKLKEEYRLKNHMTKANSPNEFEIEQPKYVYLYGLATFEKGFKEQILKMIKNQIKDWSKEIKLIFLLSSALYKYSNYPLSLRFISTILGLPIEAVYQFYKEERCDNENTINSIIEAELNRVILSNNYDYKSLKLLSYYLGKAQSTTNDIKGIMPYTSLIAECLIENFSQEHGEFSHIFCEFKNLKSIIFDESKKIKVSQLFTEDFITMSFVMLRGIQKRSKNDNRSKNPKHKNEDEDDDDIDDTLRYSKLILDSSKKIGPKRTYNHLKDIFECFSTIKNFKLSISPVYAKFLFFKCQDYEDENKEKAINIMKDVLEIKNTIIERINSFTDTECSPILLATYALLLRHHLNSVKRHYDTQNKNEQDKFELLNNFHDKIEEIIMSCKKSYELSPRYSLPYHTEAYARFIMLEYYYKQYCGYRKPEFLSNIQNKLAPRIVLESEKCICNLLWTLENLRELGHYKGNRIFSLEFKLVSFRYDNKTILSKNLLKNPFPCNVFQFFSHKDPSKIKNWNDLKDKNELCEIIECCETLINNDNCRSSSNYKDLLLAFIHVQQFEDVTKYTLENAYNYAKKWSKDADESFSKMNNEFNRSEKCLSDYFYAILCFLKTIQSKSSTEKSKFLEEAHKNFFKQEEQKELKDQSLKYHYQFYLTKDAGLKGLKPRSLYIYSNNKKNDQNNEMIELKSEDFFYFRGALQITDKNDKSLERYYANISETIFNGKAIIRTYYNRILSQKNLTKNITTNEIYTFGLLIKPDNFFMINPNPMVRNA